MRIALTGAHGVGKSTILTILKEQLPNYNVETESLTRKAVKDSSKANFGTTNTSQKSIAKIYMEAFLKASKNYITSRHMVDVLAYSVYLGKVNRNISLNTFVNIHLKIDEIIKKKIFDLVVYIPIEFPLKEKGKFREGQENLHYQKDIDTILKYLLWDKQIKYMTLTGTVEQRVNNLLKVING